MIKVVYASLVFLLSSALVFLTKGTAHSGKCEMEVTGVVSSTGDLRSHDLIIVTSDNKRYLPRMSNDEVVLVLGQKVKACASAAGVGTDNIPVIAIHEIAVLP